MIAIENEASDSMAGTMIALPDEINHIKKKFNEKTKIPLIPNNKALKIFMSGKADKKINQTINKLKLNIIGNIPSENQIEFLIKTRTILDESRFGLANKLKESSKYIEDLNKLNELIPDEDMPDWIIYLQVIPSGINSTYLWYCCQGIQRQLFFRNNVKFSETTTKILNDFKPQREQVVNQLIKYAEESIQNM
jgi:hypothetical protein